MTNKAVVEHQLLQIILPLYLGEVSAKQMTERTEMKQLDNPAIDKAVAQLCELIVKENLKAQLNYVDYLDQIPSNDVMDWKGLLKDSRGLLESELNSLLEQE